MVAYMYTLWKCGGFADLVLQFPFTGQQFFRFFLGNIFKVRVKAMGRV